MARWLVVLATLSACQVRDPAPVTHRWQDVFERGSIGLNYRDTGPGYAIADGRLTATGAKGRPLWLRKRLPHDVRVDLDLGSSDPAGELRVELFGDGAGEPDNAPPVATGYTFVLTGSEARIDRPGALGVKAAAPPRGAGPMHWRIERTGRTLRWSVSDALHPDGVQRPLLEYVDPHPLEDDTHIYFAFLDGTDAVWFDNLVITPL